MYVYKESALTESQYNELSGKGIETVVSSGNIYHPDKAFVARCAEIHFEIYGGFRPKIHIPAATMVMFKNLNNKINEYEELAASTASAHNRQVEGGCSSGEDNTGRVSERITPKAKTEGLRGHISKRRN